MQIIDQAMLDRLTEQARSNPRRRQNWNIHPSDNAICQRLLNAIEPDSYIRPHRHLDPAKNETFVLLRGKLGVFVFDSDGAVEEAVLLAPTATISVDIPHGQFHTAVCLAPGTIFFEAKAGPYLSLTGAEKAAWAPEDGSPAVAAYLDALKQRFAE
jgi:cupin fold WbuC family metalloprotein